MLQPHVELPMDVISSICRQYQVRELALFGYVLRRPIVNT